MRQLLFRVVELRLSRQDGKIRVDAYLLIRGVGRAVHFVVGDASSIEDTLSKAISGEYRGVTGEALPDTTR